MVELLAEALPPNITTDKPINIYNEVNGDRTLMIVLIAFVGAILLILSLVVAYRILKKLPKNASKEKSVEQARIDLKKYRDLLPKLQEQLEAADIDQRDEIQARIDNVNKKIKALEKKSKLPKASS